MCLVFGGHLLNDAGSLSDYNIQPESTILLYELPVVAGWSITPDEPLRGGVFQNNFETNPPGTHFEVVEGALPAGVTLDPDTGAVDGRFSASGPFSATIRATNLCGEGDLTWTGTVDEPSAVSDELPNTGVPSAFAPLLGLGAAALILMGSLLAFRRR
jgi:LPXTG-motif cell wall-anchored protein